MAGGARGRSGSGKRSRDGPDNQTGVILFLVQAMHGGTVKQLTGIQCRSLPMQNEKPVSKTTEDLMAYKPEDYPEHLRWKGEGPPPPYWWASGTKVYRSYADYCDD